MSFVLGQQRVEPAPPSFLHDWLPKVLHSTRDPALEEIGIVGSSCCHQSTQEKPGGEGWVVSAGQQLLGQFKADSAMVDVQWVQEMAIDQAKAAATTRLLDSLAYLARKSSAENDPQASIPPLAQLKIAFIAGLAYETASRTLSALRSRGTVMDDNGQPRLADLKPLEKRGLML